MDDAYELPSQSFSLTTEKSDAVNAVFGDLVTYMEETTLKFITGALDVEMDYDNFVDTLYEMGIQDMVDAYQSTYDRYLER